LHSQRVSASAEGGQDHPPAQEQPGGFDHRHRQRLVLHHLPGDDRRGDRQDRQPEEAADAGQVVVLRHEHAGHPPAALVADAQQVLPRVVVEFLEVVGLDRGLVRHVRTPRQSVVNRGGERGGIDRTRIRLGARHWFSLSRRAYRLAAA
jgi:hypothetical protein